MVAHMLRLLDRRSPTGLAIPTLLISGVGLVALGLWRPAWALGVGAVGLALALALALSARWRLAGDPDPVAAGVDFAEQTDRSSQTLMIGFVLVGIGVIAAGLYQTSQVALRPAWAALERLPVPSTYTPSPRTASPPVERPDPLTGRRERPASTAAAGTPGKPPRTPAPPRDEVPTLNADTGQTTRVEKPAQRDDLPEAAPAGSAPPDTAVNERGARGSAPRDVGAAVASAAAREDELINAIKKPADRSDGPARGAAKRLNRQQAAKVLRAGQARFSACKRSEPAFSGVVPMQLIVEASGRVRSARVVNNAAGPKLSACLVQAMKRLRFPPFTGEAQPLNYPVRL